MARMRRHKRWVFAVVMLAAIGSLGAKLSDLRTAPVLNSALQSTDYVVTVVNPSGPTPVDSALTFAELDKRYLKPGSNLSELASASTGRTNLGLGNAATKSTGTTTGTVAAGDDSRITGALQSSSNLADVGSTTTALSNLGGISSSTLGQPNGPAQLDSGGAITGKIEILYDTFANISALTLEAGRLAYANDTSVLYVGDGVTTGGRSVPGITFGTSCVFVADVGSPTTNGTNFVAAYTAAKSLTPNGAALSATNRATVILAPAIYDVGALTNSDGTFPNYGIKFDTQFVDIVGLGQSGYGDQLFSQTRGNVVIRGTASTTRTVLTTDGQCVIKLTADDVRIKNIGVTLTGGGSGNYTVAGIYYFNNSAMGGQQVWEDVVFNGFGSQICCLCNGSSNAGWKGTYRRVGCGVKNASGFLFGSWGTAGSSNAVFEDCYGGDNSWNCYLGTGGPHNGSTFRRCRRQGTINDVVVMSTKSASSTVQAIQNSGSSLYPMFSGCILEHCEFDSNGTIQYAADCVYITGTTNKITHCKFGTAGSTYGYSIGATATASYYGGNNFLPNDTNPLVTNNSEFQQASVTSTGNAADTTEDSLDLITLPVATSASGTSLYAAGGLYQNGQSYDVEVSGTFAANGNNKTIRAWYGGTTAPHTSGGTKVFDSGTLTNNGGGWTLKLRIIRLDGTHQIVSGSFSTTSGAGNATIYTTTGLTLTSQNNFEITGQSGSSGAGDVTKTFRNFKWNRSARLDPATRRGTLFPEETSYSLVA